MTTNLQDAVRLQARTTRLPDARSHWALLFAGLMCLVAFAIRLHGLGLQSLWLDEGASYHFASMPWRRLLPATFSYEPNPPLFYGGLHAWLLVAGKSEWLLRFFSLLPGVLLVALVYRIGADLFGHLSGVLASALTAVNAYLFWLSQEARMYSLLAALSVALWLVGTRCATNPSARRWVAFAFLLLATLYTHFFGLFSAVVAIVVVLFIQGPAQSWRAKRAMVLAIGVPCILYVPWLVSTLRAGAAGVSWRAPVSVPEMLSQLLDAFSGAMYLTGDLHEWLRIGAAVLVVIGVGVSLFGIGRQRRGAVLAPVGLVLPIGFVVAASRLSPIFDTTYLASMAPLFLLAVGVAIGFLARQRVWLGAPALVPCMAICWLAIQQAQTNPAFRKEDFRTAAYVLNSHTGSSDVIVLLAEYIRLPLGFYYHGAASLFPFNGKPTQPAETLTPALEHADVAWLVLSHAEQVDPKGNVKQWFDSHFPPVTQGFPRGIQMFSYRVDYLRSAPPSDATPAAVQFGPDITLVAYKAETDIAATDTLLHPPSNWLHVVLYWRAQRAIDVPHRSSVQVVDGRGVWGDELARPTDALAFAAKHWAAGQVLVEDVDVNLNPATPPGVFQLTARLLDANGQPVPITKGNATLGNVQIVAP